MPDPAVFSNYYEFPGRERDEIWCYCDRPCYSPGERLSLQVSTTAKRFDLEIGLDAAEYRFMYRCEGIAGKQHQTPDDASVTGCGWPSDFEFEIPPDWPSGAYRVTCRIDGAQGAREQHRNALICRCHCRLHHHSHLSMRFGARPTSSGR